MHSEPLDITIILPCAGAGARLGLKQPKELLAIAPGIRLIDFALAHIAFASTRIPNISLKVAIVIRPGKETVVTYVRNRIPHIPVVTSYFNNAFREWPGSVWSAQAHYSSFNQVFLPDSVVRVSKDDVFLHTSGECLISSMIKCLKRHPLCFGVVPCRSPEKLFSLGALFRNDDGTVIEFKDKPEKNFGKYNGFWSCYGFRLHSGKKTYQFLDRSLFCDSPRISDHFNPPPGSFILADHVDLGTWPSIRAFLNSETIKSTLSSVYSVFQPEVPAE